eukprot:1156245-Pelagomonas_calceolata.AAC.1
MAYKRSATEEACSLIAHITERQTGCEDHCAKTTKLYSCNGEYARITSFSGRLESKLEDEDEDITSQTCEEGALSQFFNSSCTVSGCADMP